MYPRKPQAYLSSEWLTISRTKRKKFSVPFFEHTQVKFQDREKWVSLIFDLRLETTFCRET
jgi:hypothetical protein